MELPPSRWDAASAQSSREEAARAAAGHQQVQHKQMLQREKQEAVWRALYEQAAREAVGKTLRPFLRKGKTRQHQETVRQRAKQRVKHLELDDNGPQEAIVYSRKRSRVNDQHHRVRLNDCAHGRGCAMPLGYSDRQLVEGLERAAAQGDHRALDRLTRISNATKPLSDSARRDVIHSKSSSLETRTTKPESTRAKLNLAQCASKRVIDNDGNKVLMLTTSPRSVASSEPDETSFSGNQKRLGKRKKPRSPDLDEVIEDGAASTPSATQRQRQTALIDVLPWYTDYDLSVDDRALRAAENAAWRKLEQLREEREHAMWLALPEVIPDKETTNVTLLRLELRLATSVAQVWVDSSTGEALEHTKRWGEIPNPTQTAVSWPTGFFEWWLSDRNSSTREVFLKREVLEACEDPKTLGEASKVGVANVQPRFAESSAKDERQRWRSFRSWYFGSMGAIARQAFLKTHVSQVERVWTSKWATWVRHAAKNGFQSGPLPGNCNTPLRWRIVEGFGATPKAFLQERRVDEFWGPDLNWTDMSHQERFLELQTALLDKVVQSLAFVDGVLPPSHVQDDSDEGADHQRESSPGEASFDMGHANLEGDDSRTHHLLLWFSGHAEIRDAYLRREMLCAAGDFALDKSIFLSSASAVDMNLEGAGQLKRRLSEHAVTKSSSRVDYFRRTAVNDELSALREAIDDDLIEEEEDQDEVEGDLKDWLQVMESVKSDFGVDLEGNLESLQPDTAVRMDHLRFQLFETRKHECIAAQRDLDRARALYEEVRKASQENRNDKFCEARATFQQERRSIRSALRRTTALVKDVEELGDRILRLEAEDSRSSEDIHVAEIRKKTAELVAQRQQEVMDRISRLQVETLEISLRVAQEKFIELLKLNVRSTEANVSTKTLLAQQQPRADAVEEIVLNQSGKRISINVRDWDDTAMKAARAQARQGALQELEGYLVSLKRGGLLGLLQGGENAQNVQGKAPLKRGASSLSIQVLRSASSRRLSRGGIVLQDASGFLDRSGKLRRASSELTLEADVGVMLQTAASQFNVFEDSDVADMKRFQQWYAPKKALRLKYLGSRIEKLREYMRTMHSRGEATESGDASVFDPEEALEPPPINASVLRRMRLLKIRTWYKPSQLQDDDERLRKAEQAGRKALQEELERLNQEQMRNLRKNLMKEIAKEVLFDFRTGEAGHRNSEQVDLAILRSLKFTARVPESTIEDLESTKWEHGNGLLNGDEAFDVECNNREAREAELAAEQSRQDSELRIMRIEDESTRRFYVLERRRNMQAAEEAELNVRVELEREEDRQRRDHPSGLCWRELLNFERQEMAREDQESKERWNKIKEHRRLWEEQQLEEERLAHERQLHEEELMWKELERQRAQQVVDERVMLRELDLMGVEDFRSKIWSSAWEAERFHHDRLRWMESIAFQPFKPFFDNSITSNCDNADKSETEKKVDQNRAIGETGPRVQEFKERTGASVRSQPVDVATEIRIHVPLSNKYQQVLGIPAQCRSSETFVRKFHSLRKLNRNLTHEQILHSQAARCRAAHRATMTKRQLPKLPTLSHAAPSPGRLKFGIKGIPVDKSIPSPRTELPNRTLSPLQPKRY